MTDRTAPFLTPWPRVDEIAARVNSRHWSAAAQARLALAVAEARDPRASGIATLMGERALQDADAVDRAVASGAGHGILAGVPVVVKDNIAVAGHTPDDVRRFEGEQPAPMDAPCIARLTDANAVLVGTAQMAEWAMGPTGVNSHWPPLGNPIDATRVPGGSSSGSAVVVATGVVPVALGTDTGGSVRIPAAMCGLVGYRPSEGVVPVAGVLPVSQTFDRVGVLARRVADVATAVRALSAGSVAAKAISPSDLRIGVLSEASLQLNRPLDPAYRMTFDRLAAAGPTLGEVRLPGWREAATACRTLVHFEAASVHAARLDRAPERFGEDVSKRLMAGRSVTPLAADEARSALKAWHAQVTALLQEWNVLIAPTCEVGAPVAARVLEDRVIDDVSTSTYAVSASLGPALSIPCGNDVSGMPLGLQVIGRLGGDATLLSIGIALEASLTAART